MTPSGERPLQHALQQVLGRVVGTGQGERHPEQRRSARGGELAELVLW
jgi:hypothetical protein